MSHPARIFGTLHPFVESGDILGRTVANSTFLTALIDADYFDEYHFFLANNSQIETLERFFYNNYPKLDKKRILLALRKDLPDAIIKNDYFCFHLSDSIADTAPLCALRNALAKNIFPVTGVTHSLSYVRYLPHFLAQLWQGCTVRDAIIVTSTDGVKVVNNIFEQLSQHFHSQDLKRPELKRIPLGINTKMFASPDSKEKIKDKEQARKRLNIPQNSRVALVLGRFSHYSKMDLLPLLKALQRAISLGLDTKNFVLILAGAKDKDDITPYQIQKFAQKLGIQTILKESPSEEEKKQLFNIADIFISPSDNIQETFGITIIEAALAGLAVLASDYDGYKDLVQHNTTGLLIPTIGFSSTKASDVLGGFLFDSQYHLRLSQQTALNIPLFAEYLIKLVNNSELCIELGRNAYKNALEKYDWNLVIKQYINYWEELNAKGISQAERERLKNISHPFNHNFSNVFGHYTTSQLGDELLLKRSEFGTAFYNNKDFPVIYAEIEALVSQEFLKKLMFVARKACTVKELRELFFEYNKIETPNILDQENAEFILLWCLKQDLLELV
ncbi:glycosyltransferase family 4 protein [Desulfovibrio litoralis]|uniref:Glycosyltransferase involved in cell wall bisynthesis n=1 Tax=Desulfovibrio litoralis DSM 11393 TaxID=1121455 RepID=A0A1M7SYC1_9BACT|nr:glycosyltransferase family 4 protein [Desulfovibrio litoralis]SHN63470.1 Glycosyltransferase involved in cell wall bisynthesis [Desulfovibrio litoralis DSM 11393]